VQTLTAGDPDGVGSRVRYLLKGRLSMRLAFEATIALVDPLRELELQAEGDLAGTGRWELEQQGEVTGAGRLVLEPGRLGRLTKHPSWPVGRRPPARGATRDTPMSSQAASTRPVTLDL
jgi:hypothetical protein